MEQNFEALQTQVQQQQVNIAQLKEELQHCEQLRGIEAAQKERVTSEQEAQFKKATADLAKKEVELNERNLQVQVQEIQAQNGFPTLFEQQLKPMVEQLKQRDAVHVQALQKLRAEEEQLVQREERLRQDEQMRDDGFKADHAKLQDELNQKRKIFEKEIVETREKRFDELEASISKERTQRLQSLGQEIQQKRLHVDTDMTQQLERLARDQTQIIEEKQKARDKEVQLADQQESLRFEQKRLLSRQERIEARESNIEAEVQQKMKALRLSLEQEIEGYDQECVRLRASIQQSSKLNGIFEELKRKLGNENPEVVLLKLKSQEEELTLLHQKLTDQPTIEMQKTYDQIRAENERLVFDGDGLREDNLRLREAARHQNVQEMRLAELTDTNVSLARRFEAIEAENNHLQSELKRLQASYERKQDREDRIDDIKMPYFKVSLPRAAPSKMSELEWLDTISTACKNYGLTFPRRILHAFHTSLKTAEWSPLTVLSGVSGTGKSELPRLYAHFGGINFLSLPVQPNWDSQEAMLGFFNSIDNRFDAQPVLRFLVQTQEKQTADYPGLSDTINIVLLDEMNLAHVELYFAEFLSKLELRRGKRQDDATGKFPSIDVKLGSGIEPFELPLGRNVLWVGTINQDETTKSLSDKVLDRGIVINFPRPTTLQRRKELKGLTHAQPLLARHIWDGWWCKKSNFTDAQINSYKTFIEDMNESLAKVGRALGHRVWQSI